MQLQNQQHHQRHLQHLERKHRLYPQSPQLNLRHGPLSRRMSVSTAFPTDIQPTLCANNLPKAAGRPSPSSKQDSYSANPDKTPSDYPSTAFASRLKQMGAVQPNPTYSPSSIASPLVDASGISQSISGPLFPSAKNNPTLGALENRRRLEEQAKREMEDWGKSTHQGKELLDIGTIKKIFVLSEQGESDQAIEKQLGLKKGVVAKLGRDFLSIAS